MTHSSRRFLRVSLCALVLSSVVLSNAAEAADRTGRYFIKFQATQRFPLPRDVEEAQARLEDRGLIVDDYMPEIGVFVGKPKKKRDFESEVLPEIARSEDVQYIEPSYRVYARLTPNDGGLGQQRGLRRTLAEKAWDITQGSYDVVVAVTDTGITAGHSDLVNQVWSNPREIADNGVDDDGNGFVDDTGGWDFFGNDNNPWDENKPGHGTHVSGIAGAEGNNRNGIAGMAWRVKIMPVRFLGVKGDGTDEGGIKSILYAVNNGARIINASWGGGGDSQTLRNALNYMYSKGALLMAAAGNDQLNTDRLPHFPSSVNMPGVISVASSEIDGEFSSFSNYGAITVHLAAPGTAILSTIYDGTYKELSGTSMATPMVSGVGALILSVAPQLSALDLRNAILNAVTPRPKYSGKLATEGDLNAYQAVAQLSQGFQVWPARMSVERGAEFQLSAYQAQGAVQWTSSDPAVARVDQNGVVRALAQGQVKITARDQAGQVASNEWLRVAVRQAPPTSGCRRATEHVPGTDPWETAGAALSMGLPLMAAFVSRKRFRR